MARDGYYIRWYNDVIAVVNYQEDENALNGDEMPLKYPMVQVTSFNYYANYDYYSV